MEIAAKNAKDRCAPLRGVPIVGLYRKVSLLNTFRPLTLPAVQAVLAGQAVQAVLAEPGEPAA